MLFFFFSSRRRHTRYIGDWSSDVCSSDLASTRNGRRRGRTTCSHPTPRSCSAPDWRDRKSTRLNSSHRCISYAVFCLKKKKQNQLTQAKYLETAERLTVRECKLRWIVR